MRINHRLDGWSWCKERRLDVSNGVTLCEGCHKSFHAAYGNNSNTEAQYEDFRRTHADSA